MPNSPSMTSAGFRRSDNSSRGKSTSGEAMSSSSTRRLSRCSAAARTSSPLWPLPARSRIKSSARVSLRARRAIFLPTRRMTSSSVWPEAHVAFSQSRICATLMTGTGTTAACQNFNGTKGECRARAANCALADAGFSCIFGLNWWPVWRNWQTRQTQNLVSVRMCGFDPLRRHQTNQSYSTLAEARRVRKPDFPFSRTPFAAYVTFPCPNGGRRGRAPCARRRAWWIPFLLSRPARALIQLLAATPARRPEFWPVNGIPSAGRFLVQI